MSEKNTVKPSGCSLRGMKYSIKPPLLAIVTIIWNTLV